MEEGESTLVVLETSEVAHTLRRFLFLPGRLSLLFRLLLGPRVA
jgi:hypothetical protein